MHLLGLDVGTSGCKANVFTLEGEIVSSAYREYAEYSLHPTWMELNPDEVWTKVRESIIECVTGRVDPEDIEVLSLSVLGEAIFPIDKMEIGFTQP